MEGIFKEDRIRQRTIADDIFEDKVRLYVHLNGQELSALSPLEQEIYMALGQDPDVRDWVRHALERQMPYHGGGSIWKNESHDLPF